MPGVNALDELLIIKECQRLLILYADAVNCWNLEGFVALFTEEGVWQRPRSPALIGHAEIRRFMEGQPKPRVLRHVNGHGLIDVESTDRARGVSMTTVYDTPGTHELPAPFTGPNMVVEYRDVFVRDLGRWRIARRDTTVVFAA
jgi:hypothetical protein